MPPKVAIMGAGLAGLACAHELKRHGIEPTVFELRHRVGERFPNVEALAGLIQRPQNDAFAYFERLGFSLRPTAPLNRLIVHGPTTRASFSGNLGHITIRGHWPCSWETQIAAQVRPEILFERNEDWRNLAADYDYVVVATGDAIIPESLGLWRRTVNTHIKGVVLAGRFDPGQIEMWFNTDYTKTSYGYLGPFDDRRACAAVCLPDATPEELDRCLARFLAGAEIAGREILEFKTEGYPTGVCSPLQRDNLFFVGNNGGFVDPAFGFGQFDSLISGLMAGRAIARRQDYARLVAPQVARMRCFLRIRAYLNTLENDDFDRAIWLAGRAPVKATLFGLNLDYFGLLGRVLALARHGR